MLLEVVGMSGGAYALLGMQLGDVLLNWERKSAPYRCAFQKLCRTVALKLARLIFILLLILVEALISRRF